MVPNAYLSNVNNVKLYADGSAEGYYDIQCRTGYALNPNIGGRIACVAWNTWSHPLPQCNCMLFYSISDNTYYT
jgi:hypothetical protein